MWKNLAPTTPTLKWFGLVSILLIIVEPWVAALWPAVGIGAAGSGLIGLGTYGEFLPYFRHSFGRRVLLALAIVIVTVITMIYSIAVFMLLKR
ncbi:hypothetical protein [Lactiplantibacillus fabifermentans]|uniref:Uncharacterized protein n=2 Tax=Lactiplantibacillus fabifermentans TaxID=483011 RepID=A0A0R2NZM3_9LACO|nr:hypothetical protein [Lactiplantibacillus fabifermentans]ETY75582.1 hypothetical protein LFAB_01075 [Lactiplantibacillus fabifermentans T30PCM01]KRO28867.1 hypothetical protein DY78_GL001899 [Lactiplantibacillus fabifermentans DSM 21115]